MVKLCLEGSVFTPIFKILMRSLEEQSDQGLHCLLFHLHVFGEIVGILGLLQQGFLVSENS